MHGRGCCLGCHSVGVQGLRVSGFTFVIRGLGVLPQLWGIGFDILRTWAHVFSSERVTGFRGLGLGCRGG